MTKSDPEYKNFRENIENLTFYFIDRFKFIADDIIYDTFYDINERQEELVNVLSRNMLDFCDLIRFFSGALKQINPMINIGNSSEEDIDQNTKNKNTF